VAGANAGFLDSFARYDSWALPLGADTLRWVPLGPNAPTATVPLLDPQVEAAIDPLRDRLLLWDGYTAAWSLSLANPTAWTPLTIAGEPPTPRTYFSLTYDSFHDQAVAYGGYDGAMKGDLWALRFSRLVHVQMLPVQSRGHRGDDPHAVVEAAILAERDFSPDSVRIETVTMAGAHALGQQHDRGRERMADRRAEHEDEGPVWRDVNGDGRTDLVLRFAAESLAIAPADSIALLRGRTTHFEILGRARLQPLRRLQQPEAVQNSATSEPRLRLAPRSPATSVLAIGFELPSASPARLEVFDLAGRKVLVRSLEGQSPGAHELVIGDRALPAGLYLVRLAQGPRSVIARAVVLR
jgi:hypothetical protein